jgi:hypothetical protein
MRRWQEVGIVLTTLAVTELAFSRPQRLTIGSLYKWLCQGKGCDKRFQDGWLIDIHHKKPLKDGGRDIISNGEPRCLEHHAQAHEALGDEQTARLIRFRLHQTGGRTIKWKQSHKK